ELRHCPHVRRLQRSRSVEPNTEERAIELRLVRFLGEFDIVTCDGRSLGDLPHLITEFLDEVRISSRDVDRQFDSVGLVFDSLRPSGLRECKPRILVAQGVDLWELEEAFSVGLGVARQLSDLRQTCTYERHRELPLNRLVN